VRPARALAVVLAAAGTRVQVYVNGRPFTANPTRLVLQPHQEIAVVISSTAATPAPAPSSYAFPAGL